MKIQGQMCHNQSCEVNLMSTDNIKHMMYMFISLNVRIFLVGQYYCYVFCWSNMTCTFMKLKLNLSGFLQMANDTKLVT
jgi:hypothetical protein